MINYKNVTKVTLKLPEADGHTSITRELNSGQVLLT